MWRRADIEVPNLPVDVNSWGRSALERQVALDSGVLAIAEHEGKIILYQH
ncbi:hypothetical protein SOVF_185840 [Spinacia oleracea]|nr:hypothetical protein SOVF_185840 [Spinacia oleracea]